jgi:hypothetical protein
MNRIKSNTISFVVIILLLLSFMCDGFCSAEVKEDKGDRDSDAAKTKELLVGAVVKLFAKGYVAVTDINKIKETNIAKLRKMNDQEFAGKYMAIYRDVKDLPLNVKTAYGIDEKMDRSAAITKIQSAEKKDLNTIIDGIPDAFIVKYFDSYIEEKGLDMKKSSSMRDVLDFWNNIKRKLDSD